ncbi:MAG: hypothetical protein KKH12_16125 [Gammaproteobacteria bacterium]|nr:hypothetical protein [Gammaproteobacteria bacterium]
MSDTRYFATMVKGNNPRHYPRQNYTLLGNAKWRTTIWRAGQRHEVNQAAAEYIENIEQPSEKGPLMFKIDVMRPKDAERTSASSPRRTRLEKAEVTVDADGDEHEAIIETADTDRPGEDALEEMSVKELRSLYAEEGHHEKLPGRIKRGDLIDRILASRADEDAGSPEV